MLIKRLGLMAAGVAVGIVVTGILLEQEKRKEEENQTPKKKGLFAEIKGNTVRLYEVDDGRFCGYTQTKVFENEAQAMEWAVRETDAKIVLAGREDQTLV